MRLIFITIIPLYIIAGIIENNITNYYKTIYPTLKIESISLRHYGKIPKKITFIDLSHINYKKNSGTIQVNHTYVYFEIKGNIKIIKTSEIIKKYDKITTLNTHLETIPFKRFYSMPLMKLKNNIASKMYIPKNRIIYDYMLTKPNLVKRNSPITIISTSGGITISFEATALQNGKNGDIIRVRDKNNKIYKVKIDKNGNGIL